MKVEGRYRVSVLLNLVLAATVVALVVAHSPQPRASARDELTPEKARHDGFPTTSEAPPRLQYGDIASESARRRFVIDQLRAAGVPNKILARVAVADFEEQWQKRLDEGGDAETLAARQLEEDPSRDAAMREALGEDGFREWDRENMLREAMSGKVQLTAGESEAIYQSRKKLQRRQRELERARVYGKMDDRDIDQAYDKAYSEFNDEMKTLLGEERYAQSQGTDAGTTAANLQRDFAKIKPSNSQLQELLRAQLQWNDRRAELDKQYQSDPSSPAYAEQIRALDEARDQEYERVLGAEAYDRLQKEQDARYTRMRKYRELWGLDDKSIDYVYRAVRDYDNVVSDYQTQARARESRGEAVDWNAVQKNIEQFGQQNAQALQSYLGPERFAKLQQNGVVEFTPSEGSER